MNVADTSGWLAWFAEEKSAGKFKDPIIKTEDLIVPAICIYEVFKVMLRETSETDALFSRFRYAAGKGD